MAVKPLSIKDWQLGVGTSPYTGFGQMVNVDIFSQPGCVKISNRLDRETDSVGVVDELIKWTVQNPDNGDVYAVDRNGKLYLRDNGTGAWSVITGHGTTAANGEGLAVWKGYLFYARRFRLDVMEISSGTWTNNWTDNFGNVIVLESSAFYNLHPLMPAQDDFLYIGNRQYVDVLEEVSPTTPFDPNNTATYTYSTQVLVLRSDYRITCLEEQGSYIVIGTQIGDNSINVADIFIWDGVSDTFLLNNTLHLIENGVKMIKNDGNVLNVIAGDGTPRIFQASTSQSAEVKRFNNIDVSISRHLTLFPDATESKEGEILFGIGHSTGSSGLNPMGVYSMRNGAYVLRYLISTLRDGSTNDLLIGCVNSISPNRILVSWQDGDDSDEFGVDVLSNNFYTGYSAYVESALYTVGTEADPTTFEKIEVRMGRKLATGDGVRLFARASLDDPWTAIATFDTPTYVGRYNFEVKVSNIGKFIDFQTRIEITTASNSTVTPELKEVIFT